MRPLPWGRMAREHRHPLVLRGRLVTPRGVLDDGVVVVDGATIVWVGPAGRPAGGLGRCRSRAARRSCRGWSTCTATAAAARASRTRSTPPTPSARSTSTAGTARRAWSRPWSRPRRTSCWSATAVLAALADAGEIVGIHLEGPFLSADRCGAQNPADMLDGRPGAGPQPRRGGPRPPRHHDGGAGGPGADEVVAALVDVGAVPSIGHTDASAEQVDEAVDRGFDLLASRSNGRLTATHLFNGMRPLHHRDPGPIAACLAAAARGELVVELVADGTHLADGDGPLGVRPGRCGLDRAGHGRHGGRGDARRRVPAGPDGGAGGRRGRADRRRDRRDRRGSGAPARRRAERGRRGHPARGRRARRGDGAGRRAGPSRPRRARRRAAARTSSSPTPTWRRCGSCARAPGSSGVRARPPASRSSASRRRRRASG